MQRHVSEPGRAREDAPARKGGARPPGLAGAMLALQHAAGNQAVGALARRKHHKDAAPKKPAGTACTVDADGAIHDAGGAVIGFHDADGTAYAQTKAEALGTLQTPDGTKNAVATLHEVTLSDDQTHFTVKRKGRTIGVIGAVPKPDGIVLRAGRPVEPATMPASIRDKVKIGTKLVLESGAKTVWRLVDFPAADRKSTAPTWIQSNHSRTEFDDRRAQIGKELANMPNDLAKTLQDDIDIMTVVSVVEGPWKAKSPTWDKMASLGFFQWGATKAKVATTSSSLGQFYKKLEERSTTDAFYAQAWKQATDAGLSISGGKLQLHGKDATGGELESALADTMGKDKLRAYQLIAAKDWLDDLRAKTARPWTYGEKLLHPGYSMKGPVITSGDRKIKIAEPSWATTVGAVCTSKKAMALMANLLVNRPAWVNTVVWRALAPDDVVKQAAELVDQIVAAQDAKEPAPAPAPAPTKKKKGKAKPKGKPDITESSVADKDAYKKLQALIYPKLPAGLAQGPLVERLYEIALEMYTIENTHPGPADRARRLVTTELVD